MVTVDYIHVFTPGLVLLSCQHPGFWVSIPCGSEGLATKEISYTPWRNQLKSSWNHEKSKQTSLKSSSEISPTLQPRPLLQRMTSFLREITGKSKRNQEISYAKFAPCRPLVWIRARPFPPPLSPPTNYLTEGSGARLAIHNITYVSLHCPEIHAWYWLQVGCTVMSGAHNPRWCTRYHSKSIQDVSQSVKF